MFQKIVRKLTAKKNIFLKKSLSGINVGKKPMQGNRGSVKGNPDSTIPPEILDITVCLVCGSTSLTTDVE